MGSPEPERLAAAWQYLLLASSAVLSGFGDIHIFHWAKGRGWPWMASGVGLWAVSLVLMGVLFRYGSLSFSVAIVLLVVLHLLIDIAWDVAVLGYRLSGPEWAGVALAVAVVVLLQSGRRPV